MNVQVVMHVDKIRRALVRDRYRECECECECGSNVAER